MMTKKQFTIGLMIAAAIGLNNEANAQAKKVQFTGAGRTWISNSALDVQTAVEDTVTSKVSSDGSTALDFGINMQPDQNTEIHGVFRINHQFGAFWGSGIEFTVREAWVKGIAFNKLRYQVGDLNLKMTPFTMYNFEEDLVVNEAEIFTSMREVMRYENFYDGNTWRQQGAAMDFAFEFEQGIEKLTFKPFISRWRTGGGGFSNRFIGGGTIGIIQSENLRFGINSATTFELPGVEGDSVGLSNPVNSVDFEWLHKSAKYVGGFSGEIGASSYHYTGGDTTKVDLNDIFYELGAFYSHAASGLSGQLRYREVGPGFRSGAAQTRRYAGGDLNLFPEITNDYVERGTYTSDYMSNSSLYNPTFGYALGAYDPSATISQPYGDATPNRKGLIIDVLYADKNEWVKATVKESMLSEVVGTGSTELKKFMLTEVGVNLDIAKMLAIEKRMITLSGEFRMESGSRSGTTDYQAVDMANMMYGVGLNVEIVDKFDFISGIKSFSASGLDYYASRDADNVIIDYFAYDTDWASTQLAAGVRYRFSETTTLNVFGQRTAGVNNYEGADQDFAINQFNVLFFTRF